MKKAFSILAVTAIISSSVVAPFNMYVPNIEAAEGINPANLIDNPNLISSDITIDPNDKYRLLSWNNINGYGALKVEGTYAISQGARTYKIHNNHSIELDFMSLNNDTLSQTIDTEIGKEYTFSLKFSVPQYMDRTITMRAGNASRTAFTSSEGTRTATRTLNFTATDTKTKIYIGISGTAATRHVMYFSELSVTKSDKQVTADIKAVLDVAEASVKGLFNNGDVKGTIKDTTNQVAIDSARVLVNAVTDQTKKTELENNLKEAQKQLDARNAAVAEKARQEAAEASIKGLFNNGDVKGTIKDITNQAAIDSARVLVNAVTDQTKKTELENNLKEAQKQLDTRNAAIAEKARQEAAEASVKELFKNGDVTGVIKDTTDKAAIDKAQTAINAVTDTTKKAALQKDLDTAKKQLSQIGEEYLYTFKGYADRVFGTMKVSIKNMQATMSTMAGVPHSYFSDAYVSVQIEKENGTVTYSKDYIGNKTYPDTTEQATLNIGDYITVTHKEPAVRFSIDNLTNQTTLAKGNTTIYMVTSTGLVEVTQKEKDTAIAEVSVKELFKNNDVTGDIKDTTNQVSIDNAQKLVDAVTDTTKKAALQKDLDEAKKQLKAKNDAIAAEKGRQEAAEASVKELFKNNDVTGDIKDTTNQAEVNKAQDLIKAITDPTIKEGLQKDLNRAQELLDAKIAAELEAAADEGQQLIATFLVNQLFQDNNPITDVIKDITTQQAIDIAQTQIDLIKVSTVRGSLQKTLDRAQELLNERNNASKNEAAEKAVNELFQDNNPGTGVIKETTDQGAIDAAQNLINKVTDPIIKVDLQKELDKAKDLLADKVAAEKMREEAAEKAVNELFQDNKPETGVIKETTDQDAIDAAQNLINKVTDPIIKADLQKELDKAQELVNLHNGSTSPEFLAAEKAIQDLLTTLVNFGQKADAFGAVKLDTTQEKIYEAQDKLDLVPDKVVEKVALAAQLKQAQDLLIARNNEQIGNRVVNGTFDSALNGWKTWIGSGSTAPTVVAKEGFASNALKLASNSSVEQTIQGLKPNTNYVLNFYGKVDDGTFLSAGIKNHGGTQQSIRVTSADYSKGQIAFTTGANAKSATFFLMKAAGTGNGFADFVIAKADNGEDSIPEVVEATNTVDSLFTNLSVIGVNENTTTLYKNGALKITTKQTDIDAAKAMVDAMKDSYESKTDLLATLKTAQDLWDIRSAEETGNLVKNGEFDSGIANWKPWNSATSTTPTTTQENGNNVLRLAAGSSTEQIISGLKANTTYTLEIYGKVDNNGYVSVGVKNYGGSQKTARISGTEYAKASVTIRTGTTNKTATLFMMKGSGTGAGSIDDVRFKDVTPEGERPEVSAATEALADLFTAQTAVSTTHLTPVLSDNGAIKMTTTDADLAAVAAKVAAVPANLAAKAVLEAELARATTLFDNLKASQTDNLTKNSQFDNNLTSWRTWKAATAQTPVIVTEEGNKVVKLEGNSSVEQTITGLLPNTTYTISMYGKVEQGARLSIGVKTFGGTQANAFVTATDYAQGILTFTTGATNTSAIIFLSQGAANGIAYADLVVTK